MSNEIISKGSNAQNNELVLVTGGSGFVGAHCILQLLEAGYRVRTTVRSLKREADVRAMLQAGGTDPGEALTFAQADLLSDDGWAEAVKGCTFVLHIASPFPAGAPKNENELIIPAREGALRVLRAARDAGVKRVVLTSSFAAIGYGNPLTGKHFTETDWTDVNGEKMGAYIKSKALAELAAWDFIAREGGILELSVINPVGIFGPALGPDYSTSVQLVQILMEGGMPRLPQLAFGVVDVRDVAYLHLCAMTHPAAKGERFLASAGDVMTLQEVALLLKARMTENSLRVSTKIAPNWLLQFMAVFNPSVRQLIPELGKIRRPDSEKARLLFNWTPRSNEEAILATGESLVQLGLLKK